RHLRGSRRPYYGDNNRQYPRGCGDPAQRVLHALLRYLSHNGKPFSDAAHSHARALVLLPSRIINAIPGYPASKREVRIKLSRECLAWRSLHPQFALRRYISLKVEGERRELRDTVANGQRRRDPIVRALSVGTRSAYLLHEIPLVSPIKGGRSVGRRS